MKKNSPKSRLTKEEENYMDFIWQYPNGILSHHIYEHFQKPRGTTAAILHNISKKGVITSVSQGREKLYTPLISKLQYHQLNILDSMERSLGMRSIASFLASFCGRAELTEEQYTRLTSLLNDIEKDNTL